MREILLAFWFAWQAITAPFYPDPKVEVAKARLFLEAHLRVGHRLQPELVKSLQAKGFTIRRLSPGVDRQIRQEKPWSDLRESHLYICSKSIQSRPAISSNDIQATLAINEENRILISLIRVNRTSL